MNIFLKTYCSVHRFIKRLFSNLISNRVAKLYEGDDSLEHIIEILTRFRRFRPLIIVDSHIKELNFHKYIVDILKENNVSYSIYSEINGLPTFGDCYAAYDAYKNENCDCIIALGGGSIIDIAKIVGAKIANPRKDFFDIKGRNKVKRKIPLIIAIPTMPGSGNESTDKAVIMNEKTNERIVIIDSQIIPHFVILNNIFLTKIPNETIAYAGMSALVNSIEVYVGISSKKAKVEALEAAALIKNNLLEFYNDVANKNSMDKMQKASYLAGLAITEGGVGYTNAIASSILTKYQLPYGLLEGIFLPYVLKAYGRRINKSLAQISDYLGLSSSNDNKKVKAAALLNWIEELNSRLNIPTKLLGVIKDEDILGICSKASKEANPLYPVPVTLDVDDLEIILLKATK